MNPYISYLLKAIGSGVFVANGVLIAAVATDPGIPDVDLAVFAAMSGLQGALAYLGIGQVSKTLEPEVGIRKDARASLSL